jgi:hypothetical protein
MLSGRGRGEGFSEAKAIKNSSRSSLQESFMSYIPPGKLFPAQELSALGAVIGELHHLQTVYSFKE